MRLRFAEASPRLAPFVSRFLLLDTEGPSTLLPDVGLVLGVRFAGRGAAGGERMPDLTLRGLDHGPRLVQHSPGSRLVLAQFRPGGAAACFATPLHELAGLTVPLAQLVGRAAELGERVAEADDAARVQVVDDFLVGRLRGGRDRVVAAALQAIDAAGGALRIDALARELGLSQDRLEKRFRVSVGAPPKRYARTVRLRAIVAGGGGRLTELAHLHGYFDQAHFNNDFKKFTGQAPGEFFAGKRAW